MTIVAIIIAAWLAIAALLTLTGCRWLAGLNAIRDQFDQAAAAGEDNGGLDVADALEVASHAGDVQPPGTVRGVAIPRPPSPIVSTSIRYACGCERTIDRVGEIREGRYCREHSPFRRWETELNEADL